MRKAKRGGDDLTRSLRKNRRACKNGSLVSGRFLGGNNQDVWSGLGDELKSYFSKNVACITLCNGNTVLFSCSGIAMECQGCHLTRFLTSANLVRALNGTTKDHDDLKIEVRHEGSEVHMGFVDKFDLDHNFAVVNVRTFLDVQVGPFQRALEILPQGELLSVWRGVSGQMMAKSVELDGDSRVSEDDVDPKRKNSQEAWEGGPLLSVDGKFVGMNLFFTMRRAVFLPWGTILKPMEHYWTSQQKKTGLAQSKPFKVYRFGSRFIGGKSNSHPEGEHNTGTPEVNGDLVNQEQLDLDSMGYPKLPSTMLGAGMMLVNTFEEAFGDTHGKGVWRKFSKSANINRNVVALASFNGEKRLFACTGFFIEWNGSMTILTSASLVRDSGDESNIVENLRNLRIEVLLDNKCKEGTLEHCSLHYNVALVSVKDCPPLRPSNTLLHCNKSFKVAAVGRCFKSGTLMATSGRLVSWTGTLDCHFLVRSTCKITKAGIGGPLVNFDGDIIGMNFYDKKIGTPFLLWADICKILSSFETKSTLGDPCFWKMEGDDKINLNRWPVPMPRWCYPGEDKSDTDDELGFVTESGRMQRYGYILGKKVMLL